MGTLLYDLHQDVDQKWRWHAAKPGSVTLIVSRRQWTRREEAAQALSRFLRLFSR